MRRQTALGLGGLGIFGLLLLLALASIPAYLLPSRAVPPGQEPWRRPLSEAALGSAGEVSNGVSQGAAPPEGAWLGDVQRRIGDGEYAVRMDGESLRATNRAHGLRAHFELGGVHVTSRQAGGAFRLGVRLMSFGPSGAEAPAGAADPWLGRCADDARVDESGDCLRRVEYVRPGITEWWANSTAGIEHGFTVDEPAGDGLLALDIEMAGMESDIEPNGNAVLLTSAEGATLRYAGLSVYGADGRALPAWFEPSVAGVRIVTDTAAATWPVTIDPLLTTVAWTAESDQASAIFGASVASAGDVNGDGFGDVIVGAPNYDNGQTNEGRAFVYLGSGTGLQTYAAWAAESDQAEARFAYSVASAGDVNGDGFGDVIVGAYLEILEPRSLARRHAYGCVHVEAIAILRLGLTRRRPEQAQRPALVVEEQRAVPALRCRARCLHR